MVKTPALMNDACPTHIKIHSIKRFTEQQEGEKEHAIPELQKNLYKQVQAALGFLTSA